MLKLPKALLLLLIAAPLVFSQQRSISDAEVMKVHRSALLIDTHNDVTSKTVAAFDIGKRSTEGHTDLARLREGGVGGVFFAVYVGANFVKGNQSAHRALEMIDTVRHDIAGRYPSDFTLRASAAGVVSAHKQGLIAVLMGIEGGHAIEDSLRLLRDFYELGVRYMTLTHVNTNNWADSSGDIDRKDVKHHNGLTDFGRDVVREMNRLGMLVDVSHVSDKTFWDALETSKAPVFASHSSCRALSNIPRNMTDEMIVAMAKKGGVIQINFGCEFLSQKSADVSKRLNFTARYRTIQEKFKNNPEKERAAIQALEKQEGSQIPPATLDDVVAHIDHVVKIAGIEAVGIGSDFNGVTCVPVGLEDVSKFPNLTRALLEKGYSAADIRKIYGGNTLRLMAAAEKTARGL
jgi:membrane dipeptidase